MRVLLVGDTKKCGLTLYESFGKGNEQGIEAEPAQLPGIYKQIEPKTTRIQSWKEHPLADFAP